MSGWRWIPACHSERKAWQFSPCTTWFPEIQFRSSYLAAGAFTCPVIPPPPFFIFPQLGWLASKSQQSPCLCPTPSFEFTDMINCTKLLKRDGLHICSYPLSAPTHWAICPVLGYKCFLRQQRCLACPRVSARPSIWHAIGIHLTFLESVNEWTSNLPRVEIPPQTRSPQPHSTLRSQALSCVT